MWSLLALAHAAPVPLPELTTAEVASLEKGQVVVRDTSDTAVVAFIDIAAPPETVLKAVLDLPARADDIDSLDKVTVYRDEPEVIGAKYEASVVGFSAEFHVLYSIDWGEHYTEYTIDASKENDLTASDGAYQVYENGEGSRMMYTADISGGNMPVWIKRTLVSGSMNEQLEGMRKRAERD